MKVTAMERHTASWSLHVSREHFAVFINCFDRILWHFELTPLFCFWCNNNYLFTADGLWDVMSNQEVNDMVLQVMEEFDPRHGITWEEGGAYQEAAQMLTHEAYIRGSSDNIGVCVVAMG